MRPVVIVPGWGDSGPAHWQSLWEASIPEARRVRQRDWHRPDPGEWIAALDAEIRASESPPVLVAHSLGCLAVVGWAAAHDAPVAGALLAAPSDVEREDAPGELRPFAPIPLAPLPFRSVVVASENDPYAAMARSRAMAAAWGSRFVSAGAAGHLNSESGFGPWPLGKALLAALRAEPPRWPPAPPPTRRSRACVRGCVIRDPGYIPCVAAV